MNNIRFSGIASGLDTDSIVKQLMDVERLPLIRYEQEKQTLEWKRDDYREINKALFEFDDYLFKNMALERDFLKSKVTSSNDSLVGVKAVGPTSNANMTFDKVHNLATATRWTAPETVSYVSGTARTISFDYKKPGETSFSTVDIEVKETDTFQDVMRNLNQSSLGISFYHDEFTDQVVVSSKDTGSGAQLMINDTETADFMKELGFSMATSGKELGYNGEDAATVFTAKQQAVEPFKIESNSLSFEITAEDGTVTTKTVNINETEELDSVIKDLNDASLGFSVNLSKDNKVEFIVDASSEIMSIEATDELTASVLDQLGFVGARSGTDIGEVGSTRENVFINDNIKSNGENARLIINGIETEKASNNFQIDGIEYTLKSEFSSGQAITVDAKTDVDAMFDKIIEFMDKYNQLIDKMQGKVEEELYRDYKPLTDEERESLSEKQIEQWEEKSKSGLLRNDSILSNTLNELRAATYQPVDGLGNLLDNLTAIGIVTSKDYLEGGKLLLDPEIRGEERLTGEERLRKALEENPNAVFDLFNKNGDATAEKGIVDRMRDTLKSAQSKITERAGKDSSVLDQYTIGKELTRLEEDIYDFEEKLIRIEDRYWREFTAMEKAMQQYNSQADYLVQSLTQQS
ncbi:flagellar filament capping protein FliD [Bacillus solimangrovi]|uniref:Flagellar hook-associated protein 2 n=1 Tax=Bacillus solimangrovi TaxID=1305675 RepID=A0A1E5LDQ0_9BACI|nr:flagellar filament capping protein FliD [Bacillus solimangrovi]OEH92207.1 hypothetical protein BFG57_02750 [Bacillus solimangrovi]